MKNHILSLAFLCLIATPTLFATHELGKEISYKQLANDTFEVSLFDYIDCSGTPPIGLQISINGTMHTLLRVSLTEITPICQGTQTTCNGGTLPGINKAIYSAKIHLPIGTNYIMEANSCCRNGLITNIANPNNNSTGVRTILDRTLGTNNNSPTFDPFLSFYSDTDTAIELYFGGTDPDNDSLSYKLANGQQSGFINDVTYKPKYSGTNPLDNKFINFDSHTGLIKTHSIGNQFVLIAVEVTEWRNGLAIASVHREFLINLKNLGHPRPSISGIDSSNSYQLTAYPGDTLDFDIFSADPNPFDSTTLSSLLLPSFLTETKLNSTQYEAANYYGILQSSHVSNQAYKLLLHTKDYGCPYVHNTYAQLDISVIQPNTQDVWPGDANNDKVADNVDVLSVGYAMGASGSIRPNASNTWIAQPANDWGIKFPSTLDYKYTDCDGSGTIDNNDFQAITLNYGKTHPKNNEANINESGDIRVVLPANLDENTSYKADLYISDDNKDLNDVYGIAFTIVYNDQYMSNTAKILPHASSFFGTKDTDYHFFIHHDIAANTFYCAITRIDGKAISGKGIVGTFDFTLTTSIPDNSNFDIATYVDEIRDDKFDLLPGLDGSSESIINLKGQGVGNPELNYISIYPNPSQNYVNISNPLNQELTLTIIDVNGKIVQTIEKANASTVSIDISHFANGHYILRIQNQRNTKELPFIKQ